MKRGLKIFIFFSVFIILGLSFISAGFLTNIFVRITGEVVTYAVDSSGNWTQWLDRDNPSGGGDYEDLASHRAAHPNICVTPIDIQCQLTNGTNYSIMKEVVTCAPTKGLTCINASQPDGVCNYDYRVRFKCPLIVTTCGNGVVNTGESCDGTNLNGKTCATQGFASGTLSCLSNCQFNITKCVAATCPLQKCNGDNLEVYALVNGVCTLQTLNACPSGMVCRDNNCVFCGNSVINTGETCSSCPADFKCAVGQICQNGVCSALCGDGIVTAGEECDDGNSINTDGCSSTCKIQFPCDKDGVCEPIESSTCDDCGVYTLNFCNDVNDNGIDYSEQGNLNITSLSKVILNEGETVDVLGRAIYIEFIDSSSVKLNIDGQSTLKLYDYQDGWYDFSSNEKIFLNYVRYQGKVDEIAQVEFMFQTKSTSTFLDSCVNSTMLDEFYCEGNIGPKRITHDCSLDGKVCQNGVCVSSPYKVDLKVNGKDSPDPVEYKSSFDVSWVTTGIENNEEVICSLYGNWVPTADGKELLNNFHNLPSLGSKSAMTAFAYAGNLGDLQLMDPLQIGIQCSIFSSTGGVIDIRDVVYVPVYQASRTCIDGVKNGDETGVDCGGSCNPCIINQATIGADGWTQWLNRDEPGVTGDWETKNDFTGLCSSPTAIECRKIGTTDIFSNAAEAPQVMNVSTILGCFCKISDNPDGCFDYEVRFKCPSKLTCTDTDAGVDYYVKGHLTDPAHNADYDDFCSGSTLQEYYCENENYQYKYYNCPAGCSNGSCVIPVDTKTIYYPAPFVVNDIVNVAIIYGTKGASSLEIVQASNILDSLNEEVNGALGNALVEDSQISSVTTKNWIVVGTPCSNSVIYKSLGLTSCTLVADTLGIGPGQAAIQTLVNPQGTGSILLVVGYTPEELTKAVSYLISKEVRTSIGASYILTVSTLNQKCSNILEMSIFNEGNYLVKQGASIDINDIQANILEISWALQGDTEPKVTINGNNAQICSLHEGEECNFYYGATTHPISRNLKIKVNSININESYPYESTACITITEINEPIYYPNEDCSQGCSLDGKCYNFGYRKSGKYCSDDYQFVWQVDDEGACENNFECKSNVCIDGNCLSSGLIQKILAWFRNLFNIDENEESSVDMNCLDTEVIATKVVNITPEDFAVTLMKNSGDYELGGVKIVFTESDGSANYVYDVPGDMDNSAIVTVPVTIPSGKLYNPNKVSIISYFLDSSENQRLCSNAYQYIFSAPNNEVGIDNKCADTEVIATKVVNTTPVDFAVTLMKNSGDYELGGVKLVFTESDGSANYVYDVPGDMDNSAIVTVPVIIPSGGLYNPNRVTVISYFLDNSGNQLLCNSAYQFVF